MTDSRQREFLDRLEPVYDRLSRYALAVTKNEMDGEDLVSATVLAALEAFETYTGEAPFLHFLLTIASRLHKRRRYRERNRVEYNEAHMNDLPDNGNTPEYAAEIRLVMDALQTLPEKMRETVVLFYVSDLSLLEIHEIQGGTLSGVKSRLRRGRERLAATLGVPSPEPKRLFRPLDRSRSLDRSSELPRKLLMEEIYG